MPALSETQQPTSGNASSNYEQEEQDKVQEECWNEHAAFSAEYTPHSMQRIPLFHKDKDSSYIDIQSVDTSNMTLLDVCNYVPDDQVDGSGHCVWNGALFFLRVMALQQQQQQQSGIPGRTRTNASSTTIKEQKINQQYWPFGLGQVHCEMGCGTGAAGIGLLQMLSSLPPQPLDSSSNNNNPPTTTKVLFLDNDPQALELCRQNCHNNHLSGDSYEVIYQESWVDSSASNNNNNNNNKTTLLEDDHLSLSIIDTIFATDVLYDLKIIRPFFRTAAKMLESSSRTTATTTTTTTTKYLVLSHVPRWFLPRDDTTTGVAADNDNNDNGNDTMNPARRLEHHIVQLAQQDCGFSLIQTTRPKDLLQTIKKERTTTSSSSSSEQQHHQQQQQQDYDIMIQELQEMDTAGAVLWVFEKTFGGQASVEEESLRKA